MKPRRNAIASTPATPASPLDSSFLKSLVGYNARRATLTIFDVFAQRMASHGLNPVEFSILSLIGHNPGLMPSQISAELRLLPPHLTKMLVRFDARGLLIRAPLASDGRAVSLSLSAAGTQLLEQAAATVVALETEASRALTPKQRSTLIELLQKIDC